MIIKATKKPVTMGLSLSVWILRKISIGIEYVGLTFSVVLASLLCFIAGLPRETPLLPGGLHQVQNTAL